MRGKQSKLLHDKDDVKRKRKAKLRRRCDNTEGERRKRNRGDATEGERECTKQRMKANERDD